jgi:GNAT superfamily N-acetyltransferase
MSSHPLPDGFSLRLASDEDALAVAELMNAIEGPLGGDASTTAADVLDYWRGTNGSMTRLAHRDGRLVGSLETFANEEDRLNADIYVHPDVRAQGLGRALVRLSEAEARERGLSRIMNGILQADVAAVALLEEEGYEPARHFYRMTIELDGTQPEPEWPEGLTLEPFDLERNGEAVHAALEEAFALEWGHTPRPFDEWRERNVSRSGYAPELWIVVRNGDEIAAVTSCESSRFGMGWIAAVGVREPWRKRGLGLAMLYEAFRRFSDRGETLAGLGVDAENPTGATRLYERAGMKTAWAATVYEKELA